MRSRDKFAIPLPRRRAIGIVRVARHTSAGKGITVRVGRRETVGECFQEGDDLVLLLIGQAEHPRRCVEIVRHFFHRPAGYFLDRSFRAVSRSDRVGKAGVACVVEMYELLQALDVAVVKERLLEVRFSGASFSGGALPWCHCHIAHRGHLKLAVNTWCKLYPVPVWFGGSAETTSQKSFHSHI